MITIMIMIINDNNNNNNNNNNGLFKPIVVISKFQAGSRNCTLNIKHDKKFIILDQPKKMNKHCSG